MKKILFLFIMCVIFFIPFNYARADESYERADIIEDFIFDVSNKKVISENSERAIVSFDITNPTAKYYPEIYYIPSLYIGIPFEKNVYIPYKYMEFDPVKFELYAGETKNIVYELKFPDKLPNYSFDIGFEFSLLEHTLSITDEMIFLNKKGNDMEDFLMQDEDYLMVNNEVYYSEEGPNVYENDSLKGVIKVRSTFKTNKKVMPQYVVYKRSNVSNPIPVSTTYGELVEIKPNETKQLELNIPNIKVPEAYDVRVAFIDEGMKQVSTLYKFRYVAVGECANISKITANQEEEGIKVEVTALGPADTSVLNDSKILCEVYKNEEIIAKAEEITDLKAEYKTIDLLLKNVSINGTVKVDVKIVSSNNKVLASKSQEIKLSGVLEGNTAITDTKGTKYEEAVNALNSLGVIAGYPDGTFKPDNNISRAEFTVIATRLGNLRIKENETSKFVDVEEENWAKGYINACAGEGIVSGYPDGTFKTSNNVTYSESLTILLNILGYRDEVNDSKYSWPENYIKVSEKIGVHNSGEYKDFSIPATRGEIAILTYRAFLRR